MIASNSPEHPLSVVTTSQVPAGLLLTIVVQLITGMTVPGTSFIPGTQYIGSVLQVEGVALARS